MSVFYKENKYINMLRNNPPSLVTRVCLSICPHSEVVAVSQQYQRVGMVVTFQQYTFKRMMSYLLIQK